MGKGASSGAKMAIRIQARMMVHADYRQRLAPWAVAARPGPCG